MNYWASARRRACRTGSDADHIRKSGGLSRVLGAVDLTFLGIGSIIGAGVYVLSGVTAQSVAGTNGSIENRPSVILSFIIAAAAALFAALSYAEFAVELPVAGGAFNYVSVTFGEAAAWSVAWNMILETLLSSSAVSRGFSGYLAVLLGKQSDYFLIALGPLTLDPGAAALVTLLTLILSRGAQTTSRFNMFICSVNLLCIVFVLVTGLPLAEKAHATPFFPFGARGTFAASSIVFFAYVGFDYLANAAEEVAMPARNLPIGILTSLAVATVLYVLMASTLVLMIPFEEIDIHAPFSAAFVERGMSIAARIVSCGALAGIVTSTITGLLSQARLFVVLARSRLLPPILAEVSPKTKCPLRATLLTGGLAASLALVLDIDVLAELVSVGTLYVFYAVCAGVYYRRCHDAGSGTFPAPALARIGIVTFASFGLSLSYTWRAPIGLPIGFGVVYIIAVAFMYSLPPVRHPLKFSIPLFPLTPALGILFTIHLLCSLGWPAYVRFTAWMLLGAGVYVFYGAPAAEGHDSLLSRDAHEHLSDGVEEEETIQLVSLDHEGPVTLIDLAR